MPDQPGPSEDALAATPPPRAGEPVTPPPAVSADDPQSRLTHVEGESYAQGDYDGAARRSLERTDQLEPQPSAGGRDDEQRSTFAGAQGQEGVSTVGGGH